MGYYCCRFRKPAYIFFFTLIFGLDILSSCSDTFIGLLIGSHAEPISSLSVTSICSPSSASVVYPHLEHELCWGQCLHFIELICTLFSGQPPRSPTFFELSFCDIASWCYTAHSFASETSCTTASSAVRLKLLWGGVNETGCCAHSPHPQLQP